MRLLKKGGHDIRAQWKGKNISILAIEGYGRRRDNMKNDLSITDERVLQTRIYNLEKALDFFVRNYTQYISNPKDCKGTK